MNDKSIQEIQERKEKFESLSLEHLDGLFRHAMSLTRHESDANDLVQEAYLKAYKAFDAFEEDTNMRAWLNKILRNTFISGYRRKKIHPEIQAPEDDPDFTSFYGVAKKAFQEGRGDLLVSELADYSKLEHYLGDEVKKALDSLVEEHREVIHLCDIQEFSYQEIADILEVPVGTIRSRLARARKQLQQMLWKYAQEKGLWRQNR